MSSPLEVLRLLQTLHQEELWRCQDTCLSIRSVVPETPLHRMAPEVVDAVRRHLGTAHPSLITLLEPGDIYLWLENEKSEWVRELYIRLSGADAARPLVIPAAPDTYINWEIENGVEFAQSCREGLQAYCNDLRRAARVALQRCEARQHILLQAPSLT